MVLVYDLNLNYLTTHRVRTLTNLSNVEVDGGSFAFHVRKDAWTYLKNGDVYEPNVDRYKPC